METFRNDGTATGIAMRATESGRDASLVAMVLGDRVDARAIELAERYKANRSGSIVMQVLQDDHLCDLIPDDDQTRRLIKAAQRRVRERSKMKLCVFTDSVGNHRLLIIATDDTRHLISITAEEYRALLAGEIEVTAIS